MKSSFFLPLLLLTAPSLAQTPFISLPPATERIVKENTSTAKEVNVHFLVDNSGNANNAVITFRDPLSGTASLGTDYQYLYGTLNGGTVQAGAITMFVVSIRVNGDNVKEVDETFDLGVYVDGTQKSIVTMTIQDPAVSDVSANYPDSTRWSVRLITGSNFDFFDNPKFKNFAGEIKVSAPRIAQFKRKDKQSTLGWGLQFGIFTYRYFDSDSSSKIRQTDYYLKNPFINPAHYFNDTTLIVMHQYALNPTINYSNWGAFIDPLLSFDQRKHAFDFNLLLHFETIWRTQIETNQIKEIRRDTVARQFINNFTSLAQFSPDRPLYKRTNFFDAYLGAGYNFKLQIKNAFQVYLEMSAGAASIGYNNDVASVKGNIIVSSRQEPQYVWRPYFLSKFQLSTTLAPIDIVFGGEIRKIYNSPINDFSRFRAFYIGAAISLESLKR